MRRSLAALTLTLITWTSCGASVAFAQPALSFSDVPANSPYFDAAEFLKQKGIMTGYADGTFKPLQGVNRAEAVKIIITSLATAQDLQAAQDTQVMYTDIPAGVWYAPYVEIARGKFGIVDGPPKATAFHGTDPVLKVQFLKMFFLALGTNPASTYSEITLPLSADVSNTSEWYYPYMRYALSTSMTMVTPDGSLTPAKTLTRGEIALLIYRYAMYVEGRRTQALLSESETEIVNVLQFIQDNHIDQAEYASARALLAARGALTSKPDEAVVKGAVKIAEGFQALVRAYRAGSEGRFDDLLTLTSDAWHLGEKAKEFSPGLETVATQMEAIAKNMADQARAMKASGQ